MCLWEGRNYFHCFKLNCRHRVIDKIVLCLISKVPHSVCNNICEAKWNPLSSYILLFKVVIMVYLSDGYSGLSFHTCEKCWWCSHHPCLKLAVCGLCDWDLSCGINNNSFFLRFLRAASQLCTQLLGEIIMCEITALFWPSHKIYSLGGRKCGTPELPFSGNSVIFWEERKGQK